MEDAFWAARQGDALLHTSFMADVLGAVLEVAANVVIDALIVGATSLLAASVGITMGCTAVLLTGFVAGDGVHRRDRNGQRSLFRPRRYAFPASD